MRSYHLFLVGYSFLFLAGVVFARGWSNGVAEPPLHLPPSLTTTSVGALPTSDAAWRWRHAQPNHWRACIMKR